MNILFNSNSSGFVDDFESIYETGGKWADYLKCNHCGERVERGIVSVSKHWTNCLKRTDGLIIIPSIKTAKGNLHERINERFKIKQLEMFLDMHSLNATQNNKK